MPYVEELNVPPSISYPSYTRISSAFLYYTHKHILDSVQGYIDRAVILQRICEHGEHIRKERLELLAHSFAYIAQHEHANLCSIFPSNQKGNPREKYGADGGKYLFSGEVGNERHKPRDVEQFRLMHIDWAMS